MNNNVLITGYNFDGYHGSMMHICELSEELKKRGFSVYIASVRIKSSIKKYIQQKIGVNIYYFNELPMDITYDYVLGYHEPILTHLLTNGLKYKHLGLGCLSSFVLLETPSPLSLQGFPVFVHSEELRDALKTKLKINNIHILRNSTPESFIPLETTPNKLTKIAVISNHIPDELNETIRKLKENNYVVEIYGSENKHILVTREILANHDLIITIGKTVQYALYIGIPVYNYDHFGGCGYLTEDNIEQAEYHNFSGRDSMRKLTADEIYNEITNNYDIALTNISSLKNRAQEKYNLSKNITEMLSILSAETKEIQNTPEWISYKAICEQTINYTNIYRNYIRSNANRLKILRCIYKLINIITVKKCFNNKLKEINLHLDCI